MDVLYLLPTKTNQGIARNLMGFRAGAPQPDTLLMGLTRLASYGIRVTASYSGNPSPFGKVLDKMGVRWEPAHELESLISSHDFDLCAVKDLRTGLLLGSLSRLKGFSTPIVYLDVVISDTTPFKGVLGWIARGARGLVYCSPALWGILTEQLHVPDELLHFVPWSVDTDFWKSNSAEPTSAERPTILAAGFNDRDFTTLVSSVSGLDLELLIATTRETFCTTPGITICNLTALELREAYARASLVVVPLKPNPTASGITTLLEAMAMSRPVIATRTAATEFYSGNGRFATLLPPSDPASLRATIVSILGSSGRRTRSTREAREYVEENFSTERQAAALASLYKRLCALT